MPAITVTSALITGDAAMTETTLNGTDSFTYTTGKNAVLILRNPTGGALVPTIDGDGGTTVVVRGIGSVDVSGGYAVGSIAAGEVSIVKLDSISEYLAGTIAINSGTGLVASILEF